MKIEYLKACYFSGIFDGTGQTEIEIDFSECDKRIVMLLGKNGSGKSTIMSLLQPYKDTFDDRSDIIMEGEEGYKEIHITHNGVYFKICHHYGKKDKSFFSVYNTETEEFDELNKNGGVKTFEALVEKYLGLTKDTFKLIKVGSGASGFVDMIASMRKSFIGKFMPNIDEYLNAFIIVNKKINAQSKEIKYIADEITKLGDIPLLKKDIDASQTSLIVENKKVIRLESQKLAFENNIKNLSEGIKEYEEEINSYNTIKAELEEINESMEKYRLKYPNTLSNKSYKEIEASYTEALKRLKEVETSITKHEKEILVDETNKNQIRIQLDEIKSKTNSIKDSVNQIKLLKQKKVLQEETLKTVTTNFNNAEVRAEITNKKYFFCLSYQEVSKAWSNLSKNIETPLIETMRTLNQKVEYIQDYMHYFCDDGDEQISNRITQLESCLPKEKKELDKAEKALVEAKNKKLANEVSSEIVVLCKDPKCEVFKKNKTQKDLTQNIDSLEILVVSLTDSIKCIEDELESLAIVQKAAEFFVYVKKEMSTNKFALAHKKLNEFFNAEYDTQDEWVFESFFEKTPQFIESIFVSNDSEKASKNFHELQLVKNSIADYEEKIKLMSENENIFIQMNEEKEALTLKFEEINESLTAKNTEMQTVNDSLIKVKSRVKIINEFLELWKNKISKDREFELLSKQFSKIAKDVELLEENKNNLETINIEIETQKLSTSKLENSLNEKKLQHLRFEEYEKRRDNVLEKRTKYQYVKDALDIKTGIPLILLGDYVENIKHTTNKLLNLAFKGDFEIDFKISDNEFSIPVYKNSKVTKDILECSGGQKALVKTSLSLGIVTQVISTTDKSYNIIYLDEIDAELDKDNKRSFLDILNMQLDTLNNEQCFIISHNDNFSQSELGLILLKNAVVDTNDEIFMQNKEIIADFR
jgi:DNA repair exonuclease SbcCD ATPase subunit